MIKWLDKIALLLGFFPSLLVCNLAFGDEGGKMPSEAINANKIAERISRVENGLIPAIRVEGLPNSNKNLLAQMKEMKVPAASIAVINEGKIEWAKAYGVISTDSPLSANTQTRFQAGSVSKPVAAFAILSLVNKGLITLDEDVNHKLISWKVPDNEFTTAKKVTLRHLLSHSSGCSVIGFDGYKKNEPIPTLTQTLDGLPPANNPPVRVEFTPFSKMSYSGGGYNVAQQLVEDVTKMPFRKFVDDVLLKPLKMDQSTFEFIDFDNFTNVALAHPTNGVPMVGGWKTYPESAAAGLWTTPTDLAKWLIEIQNEITSDGGTPILNKKLLDDMITPQVTVHGLGPVISGQGNQLELSHKGRTDGFTCGFVSFPYLKKGAIVMINAGNEAGFVDDVLRSIASEYNWPSYSVKIKKTIDLDEAILEKYVGRYGWSDTPNDIYDIFIFRVKNELWWKLGSASNANRLYPETSNQFFLVDTGYDVVFKETEGVISTLTVIVQPGFERDFKKIRDK